MTAGLALFFAAHTFSMFRDARASLVARLGALPYRGLYSL
ncbi:MAG: NnrU family protein, partial [Gammaproteobacteria bacterium]|nr:NnrU family protein [Gammaproteobacteria bacterium]